MKSESVRSREACWLCGKLGWLAGGKHVCFDCQVEWGGRAVTHNNMTDDQMRNHERKGFYEPGLMLRASCP